jgi:hypothetical protein
MQQPELVLGSPRTKVVHLELTNLQVDQLAPLVIEASGKRENVLFICAAVPFWSREEAATIWEFQVVTIPARIGERLKKLILGGK